VQYVGHCPTAVCVCVEGSNNNIICLYRIIIKGKLPACQTYLTQIINSSGSSSSKQQAASVKISKKK